MKIKRRNNKSAQTTLTYIIFLVVLVAAFSALAPKLRQRTQGSYKESADAFGEGRQFVSLVTSPNNVAPFEPPALPDIPPDVDLPPPPIINSNCDLVLLESLMEEKTNLQQELLDAQKERDDALAAETAAQEELGAATAAYDHQYDVALAARLAANFARQAANDKQAECDNCNLSGGTTTTAICNAVTNLAQTATDKENIAAQKEGLAATALSTLNAAKNTYAIARVAAETAQIEAKNARATAVDAMSLCRACSVDCTAVCNNATDLSQIATSKETIAEQKQTTATTEQSKIKALEDIYQNARDVAVTARAVATNARQVANDKQTECDTYKANNAANCTEAARLAQLATDQENIAAGKEGLAATAQSDLDIATQAYTDAHTAAVTTRQLAIIHRGLASNFRFQCDTCSINCVIICQMADNFERLATWYEGEATAKEGLAATAQSDLDIATQAYTDANNAAVAARTAANIARQAANEEQVKCEKVACALICNEVANLDLIATAKESTAAIEETERDRLFGIMGQKQTIVDGLIIITEAKQAAYNDLHDRMDDLDLRLENANKDCLPPP